MSQVGSSRTLTFLFTDVEGSTRLWENHGDAMRGALARHDDLLREEVETANGTVVKTTGDGMLAAFDEPIGAINAAISAQRALARTEWNSTGELRVRMSVHTGPATWRDGDYYGTTLNRAARIMALGHGGQILASEAVAVLAREELTDGVWLRDLGDHRLRDLSHVERVYQIDAEGLASDFAPLRSLDAYATNLPFQVTSFIGRDDDVKALTELLRAHRMVTLTGVGGVGKTRLAMRVAAEVLPDVRDGVWFCELATADGEDAVLEIVSRALGTVPKADMTPRDAIVDHLRSRDCVVVLDNCEHLLDVTADLADAILHRCEHARILATSREGLGIDGEQLRPIRSLGLPDADTTTAALAADATTLFAERATAAAPTFHIDESNAGSIVEICRRLDGIPLAIELAAARVASLQPAEIAALLDERFRLLTGSRRRTVERHQTLRATVDWSYSLLADTERTVFDRLGAFVGSFDAAAAQAVVADDTIARFDVLDALGELVAKSMLTADPAPDGTTRYQLLETMRQYALEQLQEHDDIDGFRRRHAEHYAAVSSELGATLYGPGEIAARARLDRETDNVRAAVDWSIDGGDAALALGLVRPLVLEGGWSRAGEIGTWAGRALTLEPENGAQSGDVGAWHWLRIAAGLKAFNSGDSETPLPIAHAVADDERSESSLRSWALHLAALCHMQQGDLDAAITILDAEYTRLDSDFDEATLPTGTTLAIFVALRGESARALPIAERTLDAASSMEWPSAVALAYYARGYALTELDTDRARVDLGEAIRLTDLGAADLVRDRALIQLALIAWRSGDTPATVRPLVLALEESLAIGDYTSCGYWMYLALAVLADCERWEVVITIDEARKAEVLPARTQHVRDLADAAKRAVTAAHAATGANAMAARQATGTADRDAFVRYVVAELASLLHD